MCPDAEICTGKPLPVLVLHCDEEVIHTIKHLVHFNTTHIREYDLSVVFSAITPDTENKPKTC